MIFKDDSTFWVQLTTIDSNGKVEKTGKVRLQIDVYPKAMAENNKVGEARQEPNCNPFLPPPIGRLSFSLNPLKMFVSILIFFTYFLLVITCWTSNEKKDLLLLLYDSMSCSLYYVLTNDIQ